MKKIAALISGGVDSSVAVYMLKEQGYTPDLFYIQIGPDQNQEDFTCTSEEDLEMATAVAHKYGCPLRVINLHKEYWDLVVSYTMDKVRAGLTPNPDVMCNRLIKFGCFEQQVGHEYDFTATGHYATTEIIDGRTWLATSPDPVKDQTDFLAQLDYMQVHKAMFPIGHLMKNEVRAIAEREHLVTARRKDSQGICFLGQINYRDYIKKFLGENPGRVIDIETGKVIGQHKGLWFHTIGQRKGLGFGGGPWYVVKKDMKKNILLVSNGFDTQRQYRSHFGVRAFHAITDNPFLLEGQPYNVTLKIRHTPEFIKATVTPTPETLVVQAEQPIQGVAPGQFCVLYDQDHHLCYGSGEIEWLKK